MDLVSVSEGLQTVGDSIRIKFAQSVIDSEALPCARCCAKHWEVGSNEPGQRCIRIRPSLKECFCHNMHRN